jgi:hypothetical protein
MLAFSYTICSFRIVYHMFLPMQTNYERFFSKKRARPVASAATSLWSRDRQGARENDCLPLEASS